MSVLVRMSVAGMDAAPMTGLTTPCRADQAAAWLRDVRRLPEPWRIRSRRGLERREQWAKWFNENVKPNVPGEIQQEVIDLHAVAQP